MTIKSSQRTGRDDTGGLFLPAPASATFQVPRTGAEWKIGHQMSTRAAGGWPEWGVS